MRIALIHVAQETNDFNPQPTTLRDYEAFGLYEGAEIAAKAGQFGQIGGHFQAIKDSGVDIETVPIIRAHAVAGGRIDAETHQFFLDKIAKGLKAAGALDGLALQLHGACSAYGVDDVEGAQAALCREILGSNVPIMMGLDHHANVTDLMVRWAPDWLVSTVASFSVMPHFMQFQRGVIDLRDLLFFGSVITFCLFCTSVVLRGLRGA